MSRGPIDGEVLRSLPKAELHLHLDGSLRPSTAVELAASAGLGLTEADVRARTIAPAVCRDQADLLTYFDLPISLLQSRDALRRAARELVDDLAADGVRYAEIRWAPRLHLEGGLAVREVIGAVVDGLAEAGAGEPGRPLVGLLVTAMRSHPPGANVQLARIAGEAGPPVVGFDLAGPEAEYPAPPHAAAFRAAEDAGLALTAHAGEVPGAEHVRDVLGLGVRRIAHGVTTADDPELVALVRQRDVTLDMCPTSNVQSGIATSLALHPLARLHRAGVSVTISTDDRTTADTTLSAEMAAAATAQDLSPAELAEIAVNAFGRAFTGRGILQPLREEAARAWGAWAAEEDPAPIS
jgi:adenosine deaminase